jgi:hypothetical protein
MTDAANSGELKLTPLAAPFADTMTVADHGAVLTLTFFGPANAGPNLRSGHIPVAAVAIPRALAAQLMQGVQDTMAATELAQQGSAKPKN